jgi:hypothetical protein
MPAFMLAEGGPILMSATPAADLLVAGRSGITIRSLSGSLVSNLASIGTPIGPITANFNWNSLQRDRHECQLRPIRFGVLAACGPGEQSEELTFHDLVIPFLFEAPVSEAHEYGGRGRCSRSKEGFCRFELGIGEAVVVHCPVCQAEVTLDADSGAGGMCQTCNNHLENAGSLFHTSLS